MVLYVWVHALSINIITGKWKSIDWDTAPPHLCILHLLPAPTCSYCDSQILSPPLCISYFSYFSQYNLFCPLEEIATLHRYWIALWGGIWTDRITNKFKLEGPFRGPSSPRLLRTWDVHAVAVLLVNSSWAPCHFCFSWYYRQGH